MPYFKQSVDWTIKIYKMLKLKIKKIIPQNQKNKFNKKIIQDKVNLLKKKIWDRINLLKKYVKNPIKLLKEYI